MKYLIYLICIVSLIFLVQTTYALLDPPSITTPTINESYLIEGMMLNVTCNVTDSDGAADIAGAYIEVVLADGNAYIINETMIQGEAIPDGYVYYYWALDLPDNIGSNYWKDINITCWANDTLNQWGANKLITGFDCMKPKKGLFIDSSISDTDTFTLCNGTYVLNESGIGIGSSDVTLICNDTVIVGNNTLSSNGIIVSEPYGNVSIYNCTVNQFYVGIRGSSSNVSVYNANITPDNTQPSFGIDFELGDGSGGWCYDCYVYAGAGTSFHAANIENVHYIRGTSEYATNWGIYFNSVNDSSVENMTIKDKSIECGGTYVSDTIKFTGNNLINSSMRGSDTCTNFTVNNNTFDGEQSLIIDGNTGSVFGNVFEYNTPSVHFSSTSGNFLIYNNIFNTSKLVIDSSGTNFWNTTKTCYAFEDEFTGTTINSRWTTDDIGIVTSQNNVLYINGTCDSDPTPESECIGGAIFDSYVDLTKDLNITVYINLSNTSATLDAGDTALGSILLESTELDEYVECVITYNNTGGAFIHVRNTSGTGGLNVVLSETNGTLTLFWDASENNLSCSFEGETTSIIEGDLGSYSDILWDLEGKVSYDVDNNNELFLIFDNLTMDNNGANIINGDCIGGNYYLKYTGFDTDGDGIGNIPPNYPVNASLDVYDYLPLTNDTTGCTDNDGDGFNYSYGEGCSDFNKFFSSLSPRTYSGMDFPVEAYFGAGDPIVVASDNTQISFADGITNFTLCLIDIESTEGGSGNYTAFITTDYIPDCDTLITLANPPETNVTLYYEEPNVLIANGETANYIINFNSSTDVIDGYTAPPYLNIASTPQILDCDDTDAYVIPPPESGYNFTEAGASYTFCPGTYDRTVGEDESVYRIATGMFPLNITGNNTILRGDGDGWVIHISPGSNGSVISNLTFEDYDAVFVNSAYITLLNNTFYDTGLVIPSDDPSGPHTNLLIANNTFNGNVDWNIAGEISDSVFSGNTFFETSTIIFDNPLSGVSILSNNFTDCSEVCLEVLDGNDYIISENVFSGSKWEAMSLKSTSAIIYGNNITNCGGDVELEYFVSSLSPRSYDGTDYDMHGEMVYFTNVEEDPIAIEKDDEEVEGADGINNFFMCLVDADGEYYTMFIRSDIIPDCSTLVGFLGGELDYEEYDVLVADGETSNYIINFNESTSVAEGYTDPPYLDYTFEEFEVSGISLEDSQGNLIYNNFFNNTYNAYDDNTGIGYAYYTDLSFLNVSGRNCNAGGMGVALIVYESGKPEMIDSDNYELENFGKLSKPAHNFGAMCIDLSTMDMADNVTVYYDSVGVPFATCQDVTDNLGVACYWIDPNVLIANGAGQNYTFNESVFNSTVNITLDSTYPPRISVFAEELEPNYWNTTKTLGTNIIGGAYIGGNYYSDFKGADMDGDGISDVNTTYMIAGAGRLDYLPLNNNPPITVTACGTLSTAYKRYILNQNVSSANTCITIGNNYVWFDGMGYTITYGNSTTSSRYCFTNTGFNNTQIANTTCKIGNATGTAKHGVYYLNAFNSTIMNSTFLISTATTYGIYAVSTNRKANNFSIIDNTINDTNRTSATNYDIYLLNITNSTISGNNLIAASSGSICVYLGAGSNYSSIFNNNCSCTSTTCYGAYVLSSFYDNISYNIFNATNTTATTNYMIYSVNSTGLNADRNNMTIFSSGGICVYLYNGVNRSTVSNNICNNTGASGNGIYVRTAWNNTVANNTVRVSGTSAYALQLYTDRNTTVYGNTFGSLMNFALRLYTSGTSPVRDNIYNNLFNASSTPASVTSSFTYLNTTKTSGVNIIGGSWIAGNKWTNKVGGLFPATCTDPDGDGICNQVYTLATNNIDYLPLYGGDTVAPFVNITYPNNHSVVNGVVIIRASATDNGAVKNVTFYYKNSTIGWTLLGTDTTSPYTMNWNTLDESKFTNGSEGYLINATAYDLVGNRNFSVADYYLDRILPQVKDIAIFYPTGQSSIKDGDSVVLSLNASDGQGVSNGYNTTLVDLTDVNGSGNITMIMVSGSLNPDMWSTWNLTVPIDSSTGVQLAMIWSYDNASPTNNVNGVMQFEVNIDNDAPTYDNFGHAPDTPYTNTYADFYIDFMDNYDLRNYTFESNLSGDWVNESGTLSGNTFYSVVKTKLVTTGFFSYRYWCYDDAGNGVVTGLNNITVENPPPEDFVINLVSPDNLEIIGNQWVNLTFSYTNGWADNCTFFDGEEYTIYQPENDTEYGYFKYLRDGYYGWHVECWDNNTETNKISEFRDFGIDTLCENNTNTNLVDMNLTCIWVSIQEGGVMALINTTVNTNYTYVGTSSKFMIDSNSRII